MEGKNTILSFWEYIIYYLSHRMDGKDEYQQCLMTKLILHHRATNLTEKPSEKKLACSDLVGIRKSMGLLQVY